ncbi:methylmalonyl-CoA carboxyltransferase [Corynebacterium sp. HMSC06D04]|uniref:acyl-CoA carboxylase subunit beta n=1 Tax=Corynebacterium TaxID=1716 RepID=UPI000784DDF5|nr:MULTISPECIES: acyl-CoA carboxylase subunit beta [Corynebacterium]AMO91987.1 carboxyl transferase domain protein [Corynebacterium simulans]MCG7248099.1 acyl-CoA carboxylase subunit beta [Corynebacterium simulans]MDK7139281.1 acyl-CoA carboxylase subunit beta [Corynebacterium simulans]OFL99441.1 methylmalonyl-CoA carboxyltransferase [Corynebacterium sp. HMSC071F07]OFQ47840.1 methylmalonyl-CoA carboxyltransferase [Corynebacterium sp. HMSC076D02]
MTTTAHKLEDLRQRLERAQDPGSERSRKRRDDAGRSTPRQRINALLDEGSFVETGALAKTPGDPDAIYSDGVVTGYGRVNGRPVCIYAHDKTVYGGSVGVIFGKKVTEIMDMAIKIGCPVIGIQDSGGARIQDAVTSLAMYSEIARRQLPLSGRSPQISIMMGKSAGGAVYAPVTTDFVIAVDGEAEMYVTGPNVIKEVTGEEITSHDLGSARQQELNGNVSAVVASEDDAFDLVRDLLDHLPLTCFDEAPEFAAPEDSELEDPELNEFMPDDTNAGYDMLELLAQLGDDEEIIELQENYAPNMITAFGRIDGKAVGFVANNPMHLAGCIDADAADKGARFIRICDAYNIPLVFVVDTPGYLPGVEQEKAGLIHRGAKFAFAVVEATVPKVSLIVRKAYGGAYAVMGSKNLTGDINLAWPTAQIAVMGSAAAVVMIAGKQLEAAETPEQRAMTKKMFMDFYDETMTAPYVAAERGYLDAMVEPSQSRLALRQALRQLATKTESDLPKKHTIAPM